MKKLFLLVIGLVLGLALVACNEVTTTVTTTATSATTTTTTTATTTTTTTTTEVPDAEVLGNYVGTHTVSAMGSTVVYNYILRFADDGTYTFHSIFVMGEENYWYDEAGVFTVDGNVLTLTPEGLEPVVGSVDVDGNLTIGVKASAMGSRTERTLVPSGIEYGQNYLGGHSVSAMGSAVNYYYILTFGLDGTYAVYSTFIMSEVTYTYEEAGTFTVVGNVITVTPEGGEAVAGEINADGTVSVSIKASSMGARALRTLTLSALSYNVEYHGTHTVSAMGSSVVYTYTIEFDLFGNYAFHSNFTMSDVPYTYDETGSYTLVGTVLTTTPLDGTAAAGTLNADGSITISVKASSMGAYALRTLSIPAPVLPE
jgi:hypothetical protein